MRVSPVALGPGDAEIAHAVVAERETRPKRWLDVAGPLRRVPNQPASASSAGARTLNEDVVLALLFSLLVWLLVAVVIYMLTTSP